MPFIGENEITNKVNDVNEILAKENIKLYIVKNTFRDYQVQFELLVSNEKCGKGIIYYSERKKSFRIRFTKVNDNSLAYFVEAKFLGFPIAKELTAYVDGSFLGGTTAFGAVILKDESIIKELSGIVTGEEGAYHQIGGELRASLEVLNWAKANGYSEITIAYDYEGVRKFATGEWKPENTIARKYQEEVQGLDIQINWLKIPAHTGNRWNEYVDQLAKDAAKSNPQSDQDSVLLKAKKIAVGFSEVLQNHGYKVENKGVINGQFVRLVVTKVGGIYFDLYDTKNRPLIPYIHGGDKALVKEVETLFVDYKRLFNI